MPFYNNQSGQLHLTGKSSTICFGKERAKLLFSSIEFLLFFCPVVFGIHFLLPKAIRNYWLLMASLFFYAWGEPRFVVIMICSILVNYTFARVIESMGRAKTVKLAVLILDIAFNVGILFVFKYLNFIISVLRSVFPITRTFVPKTSIALPIGISFFTFQAMSYVIDVYRGVPAQKNICFLGLYISLFPQLIAGPIVRYTTVMDQIRQRRITLDSFSQGIIRFMIGFNKKVLLANTLAEVADRSFALNGGSGCMAWLGALCYTLQIYYDFSGYSDMAIGLGRMLGFRFLENFDYPYISKTVTEFWRRWHISLGTWFRDYVYFPMGGSRVSSRGRLIINLMVVWTLTGIWHGASWNFILWGFMYGIVIVTEKLLGIPKKLEHAGFAPRIGYRLITLLLVIIGWVLFRADNIHKAMQYMISMAGLNGRPLVGDDFLFYAREYIVYIGLGILGATPFLRRCGAKLAEQSDAVQSAVHGAFSIAQMVLFFVSFTCLVMNAHNPFIYFNF